MCKKESHQSHNVKRCLRMQSRKRKNLTSVERERIKRRRMQVYYACKTRFDAAGGGFDEIEDFYKSSQRDNQQQN